MKFQATAEKTAKNLRGLFFSAAPCIYRVWTQNLDLLDKKGVAIP